MALRRFDLLAAAMVHMMPHGFFLPPHGLCGRMRRFLVGLPCVAKLRQHLASARAYRLSGDDDLPAARHLVALQQMPPLSAPNPCAWASGRSVTRFSLRSSAHIRTASAASARAPRGVRAHATTSVATVVGVQRRHGGVGKHAAKVLAATAGIEPTRAARDRGRRRTVDGGSGAGERRMRGADDGRSVDSEGAAAARAYFNSC